MESNHHSQRHQGYSLGSSPVLSVRLMLGFLTRREAAAGAAAGQGGEGGRPDSNRRLGDHDPGC